MLNSEGSFRVLAQGVVNLMSQQNAFQYVLLAGIKWAGRVARKGERRGVYRVLVGKPEGKRPLGRPRCKREDNIKMDL
jgi:hypothetical protein